MTRASAWTGRRARRRRSSQARTGQQDGREAALDGADRRARRCRLGGEPWAALVSRSLRVDGPPAMRIALTLEAPTRQVRTALPSSDSMPAMRSPSRVTRRALSGRSARTRREDRRLPAESKPYSKKGACPGLSLRELRSRATVGLGQDRIELDGLAGRIRDAACMAERRRRRSEQVANHSRIPGGIGQEAQDVAFFFERAHRRVLRSARPPRRSRLGLARSTCRPSPKS
jgi:hypothetical protein